MISNPENWLKIQTSRNSFTFQFGFTSNVITFPLCLCSSHPETRFTFSFCSANTAVRGKGKCRRTQSQGASRVFAGQFLFSGCLFLCLHGHKYMSDMFDTVIGVVCVLLSCRLWFTRIQTMLWRDTRVGNMP